MGAIQKSISIVDTTGRRVQIDSIHVDEPGVSATIAENRSAIKVSIALQEMERSSLWTRVRIKVRRPVETTLFVPVAVFGGPAVRSSSGQE